MTAAPMTPSLVERLGDILRPRHIAIFGIVWSISLGCTGGTALNAGRVAA